MDLHTRTDTIAELSIRIILENQTEYGSFPASPSFPQFRFGWLRDDTFVAQAALLSGPEFLSLGQPDTTGSSAYHRGS